MLRGQIPKSATFDSFIPKIIDRIRRIISYLDDDAKVVRNIRPFSYTPNDSHILPEALYYYHLIR